MDADKIQSDFQEFENYDTLTDTEIFTKMWTEPRRVLKYINETKYEKYFYIILFLAGVSGAFDRAAIKNMGENVSLLGIIAGCVLLGGFLGWLSYYIYAALLSWTGKWLDGKGNTDSIYRILAYAMFPSVVSLLFLVPQIAVYGIDLFRQDGDLVNAGVFGNIIFWGSLSLEIILGIFTLVFSVIGISEVQKICIGKSILNLLLPLIIIVGPILIIALIAYAF